MPGHLYPIVYSPAASRQLLKSSVANLQLRKDAVGVATAAGSRGEEAERIYTLLSIVEQLVDC